MKWLAVIGVLLAVAAYIWALTGPPSNANIGAGLLTMLGLGVAAFGLAIIGARWALHRSQRRQR